MFKPVANGTKTGVYHLSARYIQTEKQTKLKDCVRSFSLELTYF